MSDQFNLNWSGSVTTENVEQVADLFRQLLVGKRFTHVSVNEGSQYRPDVHTGLSLHEREPITVIQLGEEVGVSITDTRFSRTTWSSQAYQGASKTEEKPYITFECNKVTITTRAPSGFRIYWVFAVEEDR